MGKINKRVITLIIVAIVVIAVIAVITASCKALFQPVPIETYTQIQPVVVWADKCSLRIDPNPNYFTASNAIVKVADLIEYKNPGRIIAIRNLITKKGFDEYVSGVQLELTKINPECTDIATDVFPTHWYVDRFNFTISHKDN